MRQTYHFDDNITICLSEFMTHSHPISNKKSQKINAKAWGR